MIIINFKLLLLISIYILYQIFNIIIVILENIICSEYNNKNDKSRCLLVLKIKVS